MERATEQGFQPGRIVLLSRSSGIQILAETIKLLPSQVSFPIGTFNTMEHAIVALGLSKHDKKLSGFGTIALLFLRTNNFLGLVPQTLKFGASLAGADFFHLSNN